MKMSGILVPFTKEQIQSIYNILKITEDDVQKSEEALKVWYMQQPHLPKRYVDTALLRNAVLGSKNRIEVAKQRIENLFYYRNLYPDYFLPRPINNICHKIDLLKRLFVILPKGTPDGYRIVLLRPEYDSNLKDLFPDILIPTILAEVITTEYKTFGGAIKVIIDCTNFNNQWGLLRMVGTTKYLGIFINELMPCVLKKVVYINVNTFTEQAIVVIKSVLKKKISKKLEVLRKDNLDKLYEDVPKEILPVEYGGLEEPYDVIREKCYQKMLDMHDLFADAKNVSADETLRPKNTVKYRENEFGVEGTFKTLSLD